MKFIIFLLAVICIPGYSQIKETVYLDVRDSSANLYVAIYSPNLPVKGYLFLIPGMFQKPLDVLTQTDLPIVAAQQGILTIIPTFKTGISSFGIDSATQASFLQMLDQVRTKHKLKEHRFFVGGFSIGGTTDLKYSELAIGRNYPVKPSAVFAIDAPLDFERMYNTSVRELRSAGTNKELHEENNYMLMRYHKEFGGSPASFRKNYYKGSPYSFSDTTRQAIQPLIDLPIRLYTEPDVQWWLNNGADYSGMNAFDFAAMTNDLRRMGNSKIVLITTSGQGYRKPVNERHPHSWSIAEPRELVKWLLEQK